MKIELILVLMLMLIPVGIASSNDLTSNDTRSRTDYFFIGNYFEQNGTTIHQIMLNVTGSSMSPNVNNGDVVIIENSSKINIITWDEGERTGYRSFNLPGDVILYRPYGKEPVNLQDTAKWILGVPIQPEKATPVISRVIRWVDQGQTMWDGGPKAPFSGYITKGDHNNRTDQEGGAILGLANSTNIEDHAGQIAEVNPGSI